MEREEGLWLDRQILFRFLPLMPLPGLRNISKHARLIMTQAPSVCIGVS
jgi:hypothetical protein